MSDPSSVRRSPLRLQRLSLVADFSLTAQIKEGQVTKISLPRGSCDLGISIIGGVDSALVSLSTFYLYLITSLSGRRNPKPNS